MVREARTAASADIRVVSTLLSVSVLFSLSMLVVVNVGCAPAGPRSIPSTSINFEGMGEGTTFEGVSSPEGGEGVEVEVVDAESLFRAAAAAYDGGDYIRARRRYELLLQRFPGSELVALALYNAGLSAEALGDFEAALGKFRAFLAVEPPPSAKDARDARFHIGVCEEDLGLWDLSEEVFATLLGDAATDAQRVEAGAHLGYAIFHQGRLVDAEQHLTVALAIYRESAQLQALPGFADAALAELTLGDIYHELCARIGLRLPTERMRDELEEKAVLLERAQTHYLTAVRFQHRRWSVAAGYRLGRLYERFHADLLAAEVPEEIQTPEQLREYRAHLTHQIAALLERAAIAYEKTLEMSELMGVETQDWAKRSADRLERLRGLLSPSAEHL